MANQKVPQLPILTASTGQDLYYVVDVNDPTDDPTGSSKQITRDNILKNVTGFTATTISATTYENLPIDVRVTGGTYSNGTATFTNNTGGTFTVTGFTATTAYSVDYIDFNTGATVTTQFGRINWDVGTGTLNIGIGDSGTGLIDFQVGQEEVVRVFNDEATTLLRGEIVYVFGSQGNRPSVKRALATSDGYSVTTLGMVTSDITSGGQGYVTTFGIVSNLNTLGLTGGTAVWLSPTVAGGFTETKPQAPDHTVLIGYVVRVSATVGSIFVNISNGWELDELHDVRISAATEGDLLMRSSYSGSPVWVNTKTLNGSYTITGNTNVGGNLTVTGQTRANKGIYGFQGTNTGGGTYTNQWQKVCSFGNPSDEFDYGVFLIHVNSGGNTSNLNISTDVYISYKQQSGFWYVYANIINYGRTPLITDNFDILLNTSAQTVTVYHKITQDFDTPTYTYVGFTPPGLVNYGTVVGASLSGETSNAWTQKFITNGLTSAVNTGYLGIGTASPTAQLHVNNTGATNSFLVEDDTNPDSTPFVINTLGNVGIGTTAPGEKVVIRDGNTFIWGENTGNVGLRVQNSGGTSFWVNTPLIDTMSIGGQGPTAPSSGVINVIGSTARVGIGTTSPVVKLDVNGGINLANGDNLTWGGTFASSNPTIAGSSAGASSYIAFYPQGATSGERVRVTATGDVGIGTTIPTERLDVIGNTIIRGNLTVTGNTILRAFTGTSGTVNGNLTVTGDTTISGTTNLKIAQTNIGAAYTATTTDSIIDVTGGTFTILLYTAVGNAGRTLYIKNSSTGIVTIDGNGSETIDAQLTRTLGNLEDIIIQSDGSNWNIVGRTTTPLLFQHLGFSPTDATTYYIGNFPGSDPATTEGVTRQIVALTSGWIKTVTMVISVSPTLGSAQNSTFQLRNVTTNTTTNISTTVQHNTASQNNVYTLATPLQVRKGDFITMIWTTPTWTTDPTVVRQIMTAIIE